MENERAGLKIHGKRQKKWAGLMKRFCNSGSRPNILK
jgi:hypothetical protein